MNKNLIEARDQNSTCWSNLEFNSTTERLKMRNQDLGIESITTLDGTKHHKPSEFIKYSSLKPGSTEGTTRDGSTQTIVRHIKNDKMELIEILESFGRTRKHFLDRIDELVKNQNKLIIELDQCKNIRKSSIDSKKSIPSVDRRIGSKAIKKSSSSRISTNPQSLVKEYIEGLIADRETLRSEVDFLTQSMTRWLNSPSRSSIEKSCVNTEDQNEQITELQCDLDETNNNIIGKSPNAETHIFHLNHEISILKSLLKANDAERDHYIRKYEDSQLELARLTTHLESHRCHRQSPCEMKNELNSVKRERDDLLIALDKFEQQLLDKKPTIFQAS